MLPSILCLSASNRGIVRVENTQASRWRRRASNAILIASINSHRHVPPNKPMHRSKLLPIFTCATAVLCEIKYTENIFYTTSTNSHASL